MDKRPLESIPDDELLRRLAEILGQSRRLECELVAHIAEVDERKLYAREASPSMFAYCTDVLISRKARRTDASRPRGHREDIPSCWTCSAMVAST